jgi:hypothetical protein
VVWNIKSQKERFVKLIPNDGWGGAGLLGVTIRLDNYHGAEERLIRVLDVQPNSPAATAGLVPQQDFLLGTTTQTLDSVATLATLLRQHENVVMDLYVYNTETDMVRVVALYPTLTWGKGVGLLGAELGTGYLHRLPKASTATVGASVQRKVRYVGVASSTSNSNGSGGGDNSNGKSQAQPASSSSSSKDRTTTVNMSPTDPSKGTVLVELEPQLEMEELAHDNESEEEVPLQPNRRHQKVQPMAAARAAAAAAINGGSGHNNKSSTSTNSQEEQQQQYQQQLQQRWPPPPPPPLTPPPEEQEQLSQPSSPHQLVLSHSGNSAEGQAYPTNIQWARSSTSTRSGASTDGESSIGNEHPVRTASPVKMSRLKIASPPSSVPGAFTSVVAIFSKPPPKHAPTQEPIQSSSPAGYVRPVLPAAGFTRTTNTNAPLLPPPPLMHFAQPSTTTTTNK